MTPDLISVVRRKLRDFGTKQGSANSLLNYTVFRNNFWSDNEILLALNMAQNLIVRQAVKQKNSSILVFLTQQIHREAHVQTDDMTPSAELLPSDFYAPIAANIRIDTNNRVPGSLEMGSVAMNYIGGEFEYEVGIVKDDTYSKKKTTIAYVKTPPTITTSSTVDYFTIDVINNVLVVMACYILGFKNPQTQREFKNFKDSSDAMAVKTGVASTADRYYNMALDVLQAIMSMSQK